MSFKNFCKGVWSYLKRFFYFVWYDNSFLSWVVNVVLAFILIKFVVYPALGFALGTDFPIVAVVSGSMEHKVTFNTYLVKYFICGVDFDSKKSLSFDEWWDVCGFWYLKSNISKAQFSEFSFSNGFNTGDIIILTSGKNAKISDVVVFITSYKPDPIIHRVVRDYSDKFITKGDHNSDSDDFSEVGSAWKKRVVGKAFIRIPFLGWIKIWFIDLLHFIGVV